MNNIVFYMNFSFNNNEEATYGFNLYDSNIINFEESLELVYDTITSDLEDKYGGHDWSTHPVTGINAIGYCTDEVEKIIVPKLMNLWQKKLSKFYRTKQISPILEVPHEQTKNDETIFNFIHGYKNINLNKP